MESGQWGSAAFPRPASVLVTGGTGFVDRARRMDIAMTIWVLKGSDGRIANLGPPEMKDEGSGNGKPSQGAKDHSELHRCALDRPIRVIVSLVSVTKHMRASGSGLIKNFPNWPLRPTGCGKSHTCRSWATLPRHNLDRPVVGSFSSEEYVFDEGGNQEHRDSCNPLNCC